MLLDVTVGPRTPALPTRAALVPPEQRDPLSALDTLLAFRAAVYAAFGHRADALFELMDALASAGAVASPVHLSLEAVHRRGWGSFYAALNKGTLSAEAIEALLVQHPLAEAAGEPLIYGVDTSVWPRCDAETSPERGFYHHSSRHSNGQPIVAGWSFQWVAQLSLTRDSWTAPLSVRRVPPGTNVNVTAAAQIKDLVRRRPATGQVPLFAFDCGYDSVQLGAALTDVVVAIVVRLREGRCFYAGPPLTPRRSRWSRTARGGPGAPAATGRSSPAPTPPPGGRPTRRTPRTIRSRGTSGCALGARCMAKCKSTPGGAPVAQRPCSGARSSW